MRMRILVADDEPGIRRFLTEALTEAGYEVLAACDGEEALTLCTKGPVHAAVLDLKMPGRDGLSCLKGLRQLQPNLVAVIITAYATVESAVEAMRSGADDYITKPFDVDQLLDKLARLLRLRAVLPVSLVNGNTESRLLGESPPVLRLRAILSRLSNLPTTVLITGESGTGKGVASKELHRLGQRAGLPFISVDCSALPATLVESELFGCERGAFTGAVSSRPGKFEAAGAGTIFLDEIGTLPLELQSKLLTVLQERTAYRVGSTQPFRIGARFVAATNEDLETAVMEGRFREDLYYRLNVVNLHIPPLRQRREDIPLLAENFFRACCAEIGRQGLTLAPGVMEALCRYDWPGNVRELANAVESLVVLTEGDAITLEDLPGKLLTGSSPPRVRALSEASGALTLREQELNAILSALVRNGGHRERTAQALGITRRTLLNKMKRLNIEL